MEQATYFVTFMVAASIAAALTPVSRWLAVRVGALDRPDERRVHSVAKPRLGGVAIAFAILIPLAGVLAIRGSGFPAIMAGRFQMVAFFLGGVVIACLGALDDTKGLRARIKFLVQCLVAVAVWLAGFRFKNMGVPFVGAVGLPVWLDLVISVLWIVGVINAINLIDGLDGLAAGVTFFVASTNLVLSLRAGNEVGALFAATIAGSVVGFLLFNWNPAIVFMGDTGSMFLGYVLATTSIMTSQKVSTAVAMVVPLVAMGIPVIDTLMSIVRRFLERRPIFSPDKGHLHHRLLRAGLTQRRAVMVIYALCVVFAGAAIFMTAARDVETAIAMGVLAVVVVGIVRFFGFFNLTKAVRGALQRSQLAERLRPRLPHFSARVVSGSSSVDEVWSELADLCRECGFSKVSWRTAGVRPPYARHARLMEDGSEEYEKASKKGFYKARASVPIDQASYVEIKIVYPSGMGRVNQESDTMLQLLADAVGAGLLRLKKEGRLEQVFSLQSPVFSQEPSKEGDEARNGVPDSSEETGGVDDGGEGRLGDLMEKDVDVDGLNSAFDGLWERFVGLCRDRGFVGAGWNTVGLRHTDERKIVFDEAGVRERGIVKRSVPISTLSFVELKFVYPGKPGKKTPPEFRGAAREISLKIGRGFREMQNRKES